MSCREGAIGCISISNQNNKVEQCCCSTISCFLCFPTCASLLKTHISRQRNNNSSNIWARNKAYKTAARSFESTIETDQEATTREGEEVVVVNPLFPYKPNKLSRTKDLSKDVVVPYYLPHHIIIQHPTKKLLLS